MASAKIDRARLVKELLDRANVLDRHINDRHVRANEIFEQAKEKVRTAVEHGELTQPYLVSPERWAARTVECATNCISWSLRIPGGGGSMSGEPCRRLFAAQEACNAADKARQGLRREMRDVYLERDLLRRLAMDVRNGWLGQEAPLSEEEIEAM